jgi:hypothetical protein
LPTEIDRVNVLATDAKVEPREPATPAAGQTHSADAAVVASSPVAGSQFETSLPLDRGADESGAVIPPVEVEFSERLDMAPLPPGVSTQLPVHRLPLQAAWPVHRIDQSSNLNHHPEMDELATESGPPAADEDLTPAIMRALPPAQPTSSAVEVITPRRPRPVGASWSEPFQTPGSTRAMAGEAAAAKSLQRAAEPSAVPLSSGEGALVATEIGPLPADLWRLLDQQPPGELLAGVQNGLPVSQPLHDAAAGEHLPAELPSGVQPTPAMLQRQMEAAVTAGAMPATRKSAAETPGSEAPVDINELTRRVYAEIRRRLAVEWERTRRL